MLTQDVNLYIGNVMKVLPRVIARGPPSVRFAHRKREYNVATSSYWSANAVLTGNADVHRFVELCHVTYMFREI